MGNYNPSNVNNSLSSTGDGGNACVYADSVSVSAAPALADKIRPCLVAGGTKVSRVVIKVTDMDTGGTPALAAKIGFAPADGSSGGDDDVVASAAAFGQSAGTVTYEIFPPYLVGEDSYLEAVVTTAPATGATGTVYGKVEGEAIGVK